MKPTSLPPATPTDYAGRGARNLPTVDLASPVPMPDPEARSELDPASGYAAAAVAATEPAPLVATSLSRLQTTLREHPVPLLAAALACGWLLGASSRRRSNDRQR